MAVSLLVSTDTSGYRQARQGYYSFPESLVEVAPGLYEVPINLVQVGDGLYAIPVRYEFSNYFPGMDTNILGYSVSEEATPLDPNNSSGAVGQLTFEVQESTDTAHLMQEVVILEDTFNGKTQGIVRAVGGNNSDITVTADSVLGLFNSDHTALPYVGTLAGAFQYYCDLVGVTNDVFVDPDIASRAVIYPGFQGNMWVNIKRLCAKEQVEVSLVFNRVVMRPVREFVANTEHDTSPRSFSIDNQHTAKKVEINYYNHKYGVDQEIYPLRDEEPTIYQVDAGETMTFEVQLNASLMAVNQPECIDFVEDRPYPGTTGVYSVSGNDGLPITAAQWTAQGGSVKVKITEDPSVIEVSVTGASMEDYAPYRIAMTAGTSSYYNSLHITGRGVLWNKRSVILVTGSTSAVTGEDIGITVDNPFISTLEDAYNAGYYTSRAFAGAHTVSGTVYGINREDADRSIIQFTVGDFNQAYVFGTTIETFNVEWDGRVIEDFNLWAQAQVDSRWANQSFGNAAGARVQRGPAWFRITAATTSETGTQYVATEDTLIGDFNTVWANGPLVSTEPLRTNYATHPKILSLADWRGRSGGVEEMVLDADAGREVYQVTWVTGGSVYADPNEFYYPSAAGDIIRFSIDVKALDANTANTMQLRVPGYLGLLTSETGTYQPVPVNTWTRIGVTVPVTTHVPGGYVRCLVWPSGGTGFRVKNALVEIISGALPTDATYFDGDTYGYEWAGATDTSTSTTRTTANIEDFNRMWTGRLSKDISLTPLRRA